MRTTLKMSSVLLWLACVVPAVADEFPLAAKSTTVVSAASNPIDQHVFPRLAELGIQPSAPSSDTDFLRRLHLTTVGQLPRPDEVRNFVGDARADKRQRKIDQLLSHQLHSAMWATRLCEWTGNSLQSLAADDDTKLQLSQLWHRWLRDRFARNEPYDQLVRSILTAQSREGTHIESWLAKEVEVTMAVRNSDPEAYAGRESLDLFWRRNDIQGKYPVREIGERIASAFLGIRINCARCHDHPFEPWTQQDYDSFISIFSQIRHDMSPELRREMSAQLAERRTRVANGEVVGEPLPRITEVYLVNRSKHADLPPPKALGGPAIDIHSRDPRAALMDWLADRSNPYFARNFVNRVWAYYFGRGLVEPLDGLSPNSQSAAYPALLDTLAEDFVASNYDVRQLERVILNSRLWQLSSKPNDTNWDDARYFSRSHVRLPPAEVVVDMWHAATGIEHDFGNDLFRGLHAVELGPDALAGNRWDSFLKLFGQPKRTDTCDCSPKNRPSVRQVLTLCSDSNMVADVSQGSLRSLLDGDLSDDQLLEDLFLQTLSRWPTDDELAAAAETYDTEDREPAWESVLWSLLNTQEFITIH